jgi:hypothetical protein
MLHITIIPAVVLPTESVTDISGQKDAILVYTGLETSDVPWTISPFANVNADNLQTPTSLEVEMTNPRTTELILSGVRPGSKETIIWPTLEAGQFGLTRPQRCKALIARE